jgi:hypothetical protein
MTTGCDPEYSAEAIEAHQFLVNRIATRARSEGTPLTEIELKEFESQRMSKDEARRLDKEFGGIDAWQPFIDKISGLLKRAIEEDAASDPAAPARYEEMVHGLENRWESFSLWACCVPAISGYKSQHQSKWVVGVVAVAVLAVIAYMVLHALRIL